VAKRGLWESPTSSISSEIGSEIKRFHYWQVGQQSHS
jgi:hypothetical protein